MHRRPKEDDCFCFAGQVSLSGQHYLLRELLLSVAGAFDLLADELFQVASPVRSSPVQSSPVRSQSRAASPAASLSYTHITS